MFQQKKLKNSKNIKGVSSKKIIKNKSGGKHRRIPIKINKFKKSIYGKNIKKIRNKFYRKRNKNKLRKRRNNRFINIKIPRLSKKNRNTLREIYEEYIIPLKNKDLEKINITANLYQKTLNWLNANRNNLSITYDFLYLLVQSAYLCSQQLRNYNKLQRNYDNLFKKYEALKSRLNLRVQGGGSVTASKTIVLQYADKSKY